MPKHPHKSSHNTTPKAKKPSTPKLNIREDVAFDGASKNPSMKPKK